MLRKISKTLWTGVTIDAGDETDVEVPIVIATVFPKEAELAWAKDLFQYLRDGLFRLKLGTETGAGQLTITGFSVLPVGETEWVQVQQYSRLLTAAGFYDFPIENPGGFDVQKVRMDADPTDLAEGSKQFASCNLQLMGNLWVNG